MLLPGAGASPLVAASLPALVVAIQIQLPLVRCWNSAVKERSPHTQKRSKQSVQRQQQVTLEKQTFPPFSSLINHLLS